MSDKGGLDMYVRTGQQKLTYAEELAIAHVALQLADLIGDTPLSEVVRLSGVGAAELDQLLTAEGEPSVRSLARIANALGYELRIEFRKRS